MLKKFRMMLTGAIAAVVVISGSNVGWMQQTEVQAATDLSQAPGYTGSPYTVVNDNEPDFAKSDFTTEAFEDYSDLDSLGRCGVAYANICKELMPTEKRGRIGMVKPPDGIPSNIRISSKTGTYTTAVTLLDFSWLGRMQMRKT